MVLNKVDAPRCTNTPFARMPVPFVRSSSVTPFIAFCDSLGMPTARICRQARLPSSALKRPDSLVSLHSCYRFLDAVIEAEGLPELGFLVAERSSPFQLGRLGEMLRRSETLADYLCNGARFVSTHGNAGVRVILAPDNGALRVSFAVLDAPGLGPATVDLHTLMLTLGVLREVIGGKWQPEEIRLRVGTERLLERLDFPFHSRIVLGAEKTSFSVAHKLLSIPMPMGLARESGSSGESGSGRQAAQLQPLPEDFPTSIDLLLRSMLDEGTADVHSVAEACGMSARGLQRHLASSGTSFRERLSASRVGLARHWLASSDLPVAEIAADLGYSDASNFSRAFSRATGQSPQAFRRVMKDVGE
jgi:AraC-like DNA-binding protein